jgi:5'-deoxynucleotidase YfbR-like HD superfamily hydrolase
MGMTLIMNSDFDEILKFFARAYTLEHTHRYSMTPTIKKESVASHCFFVALGVRLMHTVFDFNLEKALCMAISHDMTEIEISDVNHAVKKRYPVLAKAIRQVEQQASESFPQVISEDLVNYSSHSVEAMVVHLADALQVWQYTQSEIDLGNMGQVNTIHANSVIRVDEMLEKLKSHKRALEDDTKH